MKNTKWIVGLSIAGIMALSGTAYALTTGTSAVNTPQNQLVTSQPTAPSNPLGSRQLETLTPSSQNTDSNGAITTPGSNGYNGGYGMMGGQGGNGYGNDGRSE